MGIELNSLGLVTALSTFVGIWLGHVAVRRIEALSPSLMLPVGGALLLGLVFEGLSLAAQDMGLSAGLGILGITFLWDALEFKRQEKRVKKGHAPANPVNPRHAAFLRAGLGTTAHLLKREPSGQVVKQEGA